MQVYEGLGQYVEVCGGLGDFVEFQANLWTFRGVRGGWRKVGVDQNGRLDGFV